MPLNGYFETPAKPELSVNNYFNKTFQDSTEKYLKYNFGLFPGLTRIHNQLEYSLFNKINLHDVHKGKDGYLHRYVDNYFDGKGYGDNVLNHYMDMLRRLNDTLEASGKKILWVVAPDKSIVYKETLPEGIKLKEPINSYYSEFEQAIRKNKINFIDFNTLAIAEKNKYPFPPVTKGGIHWTQAYAARCFDSICKFLASISDIKIDNKVNYFVTGNSWDPDYDIEYSANLLFPLERNDSAYMAKITSHGNAKNKNLLLIGDSFCHAWMWSRMFEPCFSSESEFWYYNRDAYKLDNTKIVRNAEKTSIRNYIRKFDVIIIEYSVANLEMLDYGFMNELTN